VIEHIPRTKQEKDRVNLRTINENEATASTTCRIASCGGLAVV